jgi:hypothetical protein
MANSKAEKRKIMHGIVRGLDGKPPHFAAGPLGPVRLVLWEVGASVLVATGLIVRLAEFVWHGLGRQVECNIHRYLKIRPFTFDPALAPATPSRVSRPAKIV